MWFQLLSSLFLLPFCDLLNLSRNRFSHYFLLSEPQVPLVLFLPIPLFLFLLEFRVLSHRLLLALSTVLRCFLDHQFLPARGSYASYPHYQWSEGSGHIWLVLSCSPLCFLLIIPQPSETRCFPRIEVLRDGDWCIVWLVWRIWVSSHLPILRLMHCWRSHEVRWWTIHVWSLSP